MLLLKISVWRVRALTGKGVLPTPSGVSDPVLEGSATCNRLACHLADPLHGLTTDRTVYSFRSTPLEHIGRGASKIAPARDPLRNRASTTLVCAWSFSETLVALRPPCNPLILESRVILANPLPFCPSIPRGPVRQMRHGHTSAMLILFPPPAQVQFRACA